MNKRYILTAFGRDRPGVVADVSRIIYELGGNLEDSTMSRLVDEFTIILLFSVHGGAIDRQLDMECRRLERDCLISAFFRQLDSMPVHNEISQKTHTLCVEGMDHTGIVYELSSYLASQNINIINLSSYVSALPESGSSLYSMEIDVCIPDSCPLDALQHDLNKLGESLQVEVRFKSP